MTMISRITPTIPSPNMAVLSRANGNRWIRKDRATPKGDKGLTFETEGADMDQRWA